MQPVDKLHGCLFSVDPLLHVIVDYFLVLDSQHYITRALASSFAVAYPLSVHRTVRDVAPKRVCLCALFVVETRRIRKEEEYKKSDFDHFMFSTLTTHCYYYCKLGRLYKSALLHVPLDASICSLVMILPCNR